MHPHRPAPSLKRVVEHLLRLLRLARPYRALLAQGVALSLSAGVLGVAAPYVTKLLIDASTHGATSPCSTCSSPCCWR